MPSFSYLEYKEVVRECFIRVLCASCHRDMLLPPNHVFFTHKGHVAERCSWDMCGGEQGGRRGTGGGRRKGTKRDPQSGGNREKRRKISQYCVTFHNRNRTKRREPLRKGAGSGSKRYGRREFQTPPVSPHTCGSDKVTLRACAYENVGGTCHPDMSLQQVFLCVLIILSFWTILSLLHALAS